MSVFSYKSRYNLNEPFRNAPSLYQYIVQKQRFIIAKISSFDSYLILTFHDLKKQRKCPSDLRRRSKYAIVIKVKRATWNFLQNFIEFHNNQIENVKMSAI